nr:hypothetical protein [Micromonospora sp. DSM 115978]
FLLLAVLLALVVNGGSSPTGAPPPVVSDDAGPPQASPSDGAPAAASAAATAPDHATVPDQQWYADTTTVRDQLADAGELVRRHVEASDGVALEPECARLGNLVGDGQAARTPADVASAELWSDVVAGYS